MRRLLGVVLLASALAGPAAAAERVCRGEAKGRSGQVFVFLSVDGGRILRGTSRWAPPADRSSTPGAALLLERAFEDPDAGTLGAYTALRALNAASLDPPAAERAMVGVSSNTVQPIFKEWRMYGQSVADLKAGRGVQGAPAGSQPLSVVGTVPFTREDEGARPLLDSLADARTVITSVTDLNGQAPISRGLFWVEDRAGAEALTREAHAKAKAAAADPQKLCEPSADSAA